MKNLIKVALSGMFLFAIYLFVSGLVKLLFTSPLAFIVCILAFFYSLWSIKTGRWA